MAKPTRAGISEPSAGPGTNSGHGHVWPRPDGQRARCGGAGICGNCKADAGRWVRTETWVDSAATQALPGMPELPEPGSLQEKIAVVLTNTFEPGTDDTYLTALEAVDLAEVVMRVAVRPVLVEHERQIARLRQRVAAAEVTRAELVGRITPHYEAAKAEERRLGSAVPRDDIELTYANGKCHGYSHALAFIRGDA